MTRQSEWVVRVVPVHTQHSAVCGRTGEPQLGRLGGRRRPLAPCAGCSSYTRAIRSTRFVALESGKRLATGRTPLSSLWPWPGGDSTTADPCRCTDHGIGVVASHGSVIDVPLFCIRFGEEKRLETFRPKLFQRLNKK
jgi:hypothetical protein